MRKSFLMIKQRLWKINKEQQRKKTRKKELMLRLINEEKMSTNEICFLFYVLMLGNLLLLFELGVRQMVRISQENYFERRNKFVESSSGEGELEEMRENERGSSLKKERERIPRDKGGDINQEFQARTNCRK